ncbi:hypothetical protein TG4357_01208 [Thalassovita gelatinovora]|uniref:DUF2783 domain-containing protein n=1 Tax=Thalassovita gelatinovora TaxID=53501 RepID=A0A0P1F886_THAGE|nr:DUF2783 domain-containing protein [Thalassovita gelatinovora]QIZ80366.1 DUF2783 domain-containing protein [Thalassovita gelatinovora]CUH64318.1 hypothetical protein TG4357_01208 [Thalassovita gelatinovora]SEQ93391.1 hypothetical protein SAMN04488043_11145 [Thalassovita gelatinovora]
MTPVDVETVYEALAEQLDAVGDKTDLFLAKLALLLAHDIGDAARVCTRIAEAAQNLDA